MVRLILSLPIILTLLAGNLHTQVINEFHDVFVASRQAFDLEGKELTLEELLKYPIMMLDRKSTTSEFLHQIFQEKSFGPGTGDRAFQ